MRARCHGRIVSTLATASVLATGLALLACAAGESAPVDASSLEPCASPRPEMCTRDYRPACGHRCAKPPCEASERRTYGNACDACADAKVSAVAAGACDGSQSGKPPVLR